MPTRQLTSNEPLFINQNQSSDQMSNFSFAQRDLTQEQSLFVNSQSTPQFVDQSKPDIIQRGITKALEYKGVELPKLPGQEEPFYFDPTGFLGGLKDVSKVGIQKAPSIFKGFKDLTTKVLERLKGKAITSKQEILDFTNMSELKQAERDLIRNVAEDYKGQIPVQEFANKVKTELLPLTTVKSNVSLHTLQKGVRSRSVEEGSFSPRYEGTTLSPELRGKIGDYFERIYNTKTSVPEDPIHFTNLSRKMFGWTRIEDMADGETRRIIEVQNYLYQKGNLETEIERISKNIESFNPSKFDNKNQIQLEKLKKLQQYNNPTAHFRQIREEVKQAAIDGKTKLQFPTGETAMKIEGLGQSNNNWTWIKADKPKDSLYPRLTPENLKVGERVSNSQDQYSQWIITDVLGDGKFKAVPKNLVEQAIQDAKSLPGSQYVKDMNWDKATELLKKNGLDAYANRNAAETFDISGKVDTNNPIYRFYEKEVARYLKNKYDAKLITDKQGVTWNEVSVKKEMSKLPIEAFGVGALGTGALDWLKDKTSNKFEIDNSKDRNSAYYQSNLREAIANNETGIIPQEKKYSFSKHSGNRLFGYDLGKYQITSGELRSYSRAYLGKQISDKEFLGSPRLQEKYMDAKIKDWISKGYTDEQILGFHRGGQNTDLNKQSIKEYIRKGKSTFQQLNN